MTTATCLASGAPLTNPASITRGWCREHDPYPELRPDRPTPRTRAPATQQGPSLLDLIPKENPMPQPEPITVDPLARPPQEFVDHDYCVRLTYPDGHVKDVHFSHLLPGFPSEANLEAARVLAASPAKWDPPGPPGEVWVREVRTIEGAWSRVDEVTE